MQPFHCRYYAGIVMLDTFQQLLTDVIWTGNRSPLSNFSLSTQSTCCIPLLICHVLDCSCACSPSYFTAYSAWFSSLKVSLRRGPPSVKRRDGRGFAHRRRGGERKCPQT